MITAKRSDGLGIARQLGFPTINLYHPSDNCGVYLVCEKEYGLGAAFVMPNLTEIHFFNPVESPKDELEYELLSKLEAPENGILDYFYKGLEYHKILERIESNKK